MLESLTFIRTTDSVHRKCTMQCTVHFIITLFNVANVLLCVFIKLHCIYMCYTNIMLYDVIYSVWYYLRFQVTAVGLETYYPWIWWSACTYFLHVVNNSFTQE